VGQPPPGYGGRPRARENGEPVPVDPARGGRGEGGRAPLRLPRVQLPRRAGRGNQGNRRHGDQAEEGRGRPRHPHHGQGDGLTWTPCTCTMYT